MTRDSWSCQRRVIAKAEWTGGATNPGFVGRQLDLFADRTPVQARGGLSAATMRANLTSPIRAL